MLKIIYKYLSGFMLFELILFSLIIQIHCYSKVARVGAYRDEDPIRNETNLQSDNLRHENRSNLKTLNGTSLNESELTFKETGRSASSNLNPYPYFPKLPLVFGKPPVNFNPMTKGFSNSAPIYPVYRPDLIPSKAELDKLHGKSEAMDRYTPGEAVATALFKQNKGNGYKYRNPVVKKSPPPQPLPAPVKTPVRTVVRSPPIAQPAIRSPASPSSYTSGSDLYAFPPNLNSRYPLPSNLSPDISSAVTISSYLPPPAGADDNFTGFFGPINPDHLPAHLRNPASVDMTDSNSKASDTSMMEMKESGNENMAPMENEDMKMTNDETDTANGHDMGKNSPEMQNEMSSSDNSEGSDNMGMSMPDAMMDQISDDHDDEHHLHDDHHHDDHIVFDHPHDDHGSFNSPWDTMPSFYSGHGYPEIIYDHDHFHGGLLPVPSPTVNTGMMKATSSESPPEPRVKKYSYFYIGRKLWYIPLYFTVWFSFYILFLILKSIARHKVNLPNHYSGRTFTKRSLYDGEFENHKNLTNRVDQLTEVVMNQIERFKEKYIT